GILALKGDRVVDQRTVEVELLGARARLPTGPFLLAALLSLPLDRLRVRPRHTAALAFGVTLAWFVLIKTVPPANALMVDALSHVLGAPAQIVLDPTDLLALLALVPAWLLWVQLERTPPPRRLRPADLLALGLAALATVATPPCPSPVCIARLVVFEQSVYVGVAPYNFNYDRYDTTISAILRSDDGGRTWTYNPLKPADLPTEVARQFEQSIRLPLVVCDPENPQTCYRITGAEQVDGSTDGGQTWQVAWQVPQGRRKFMELAIARGAVQCKQSLDIGPYDLAFHSQNGTTTLLVASGNEGIVVRTPDGTWQRYAVSFAYPTPYKIEDWRLGYSFLLELLLYEIGCSLGMAVLIWLALCILGWSIILSRMHISLGRSLRWVLAPILLAVGLWVLSSLLVYMFDPSPENNKRVDVLVTLVLLIPALVPVGPVIIWHRVASKSSRSRPARRAALACFLAAAGIFPLAWLPFPLWALGLIPVYEMALALSVLIGIVVLVCGAYAVRRLSRRAVAPVEANGSDDSPQQTGAQT
ncbi:MAG: hypothetical protein KJ734_08895, partial [Chloroflexi bacterium]|nr:hypothetical protein [Chloroflexota bacterium]